MGVQQRNKGSLNRLTSAGGCGDCLGEKNWGLGCLYFDLKSLGEAQREKNIGRGSCLRPSCREKESRVNTSNLFSSTMFFYLQ